jgi:hypothetical protein
MAYITIQNPTKFSFLHFISNKTGPPKKDKFINTISNKTGWSATTPIALICLQQESPKLKLNPKLKSTTFNQRLNHAYMVEDEKLWKKTYRRWLATELVAEEGDNGELQEICLRAEGGDDGEL